MDGKEERKKRKEERKIERRIVRANPVGQIDKISDKRMSAGYQSSWKSRERFQSGMYKKVLVRANASTRGKLKKAKKN